MNMLLILTTLLLTSCATSKPADDLDGDFYKAIISGNINFVRHTVNKGADIRIDNDIALCLSAEWGNLEIVKYLVESGADIYSRKLCSIRLSAENGHSDIFYYLIDKAGLSSLKQGFEKERKGENNE